MIAKLMIVLIAVTQIVTGVFLYRARVLNHWSAGDLLVFGMPVGAALVGQLIAAAFGSPRLTGRRVGIAAIISALAFFATMLINLNAYGS